MLHGDVPEAAARLTPEGRLHSAEKLRLAIGLPLRNPGELADLIRQLYDPASPNFRQYLSPAQFTAQFGPVTQDYQAVIDFAKANGLTVTGTHPNRLIVDVEGSVADIEKTFHITMFSYQHPKETRKFFAPDVEPSVDLTVPIVQISGLNNYSIPHPNSKIKPAALAAQATPNAGSGPGGAYAGGDFRAAYVPGTTLTGAGQSVGLLQFDGYYASDIAAYKTQFGLPDVPLVNVPIDGGVSTPGTGNSEVCLDIEMVLAMAPGISAIYVYIAPNPSPWVDLLSRMANDNICKQLSCSWGGGSPDANAESIFQQMAAQGQSFFNATGDSDAFTASIPFPSDSPNITEVGATTLTTTGSGGSYVSETVWNWNNGTGSSGGTSTFYSIPTWQQAVSMTTNQGSTTMRNVPDVAMTGDNVYVRYNNGGTGTFGGTSCAAPLWAGFIALVNQRAATNGRATVGFINPAIYALGEGASYGSTLHDTATGNNFSTTSPTRYSGVTGYDLCTGWGTPAGSPLIDALAGPADSLQLTPASSFAANGYTGGPFTPSAKSYTLVNSGASSLTWTANVTQSWLTLSATTGTLLAGGSATVTASLNAGANALGSGSYSDTITFSNGATGFNQTRPASLIITTPSPVLTVTPVTTFTASGFQGGPFSPSSTTYSVANTGSLPMNWAVSNTTSWLTVSSTSGTLAVGGSTTVTASIITSAAASLSHGSYSDTLRFVNLNNGTGNTSIGCALTVSLDYFTQLFASGSNNTSNHSFTFTPNGSANYYSANCDATTTFPTSPTGGTKLTMADDTYTTVTLTGTASAKLYGTAYSTFYVGSNGYVTFGSGDTSYSATLATHFNKPRIAGLYRDLNPATGGTISWKQLTDRAVVTYQNVPAYKTTNSNNFQIEMFFDGRIRITILSIASKDGLIGLSQGLGTPTGFINSTFVGYPPNNPVLNVTPINGLNVTGTATVPFAPPVQIYTLTNTGNATMSWTVLNNSAWLSLSATSGVLASGSSTTVTAALNSNVNTLLSGSYTDTVTFTNSTNGNGNATRNVLLTLVPDTTPPVLNVTTPDHTTTNQPSVTLMGTATAPSGISSVVANGVTATTSDGFAHWTATVGKLTVGINSITVTATDGAAPANTSTASRQILYYTLTSSLFGTDIPDAWKVAHGLDPFSNTGVNNPTGNPSGDGISNLMKYALNLDPQKTATPGLPFTTTALNPSDNQTYLIFNYRRIIGGGGLTYIVEASTDFTNWTSSSTDLVEISAAPDPDGITEDVQVRVLPALDTPATGSKFIRLRVTAP